MAEDNEADVFTSYWRVMRVEWHGKDLKKIIHKLGEEHISFQSLLLNLKDIARLQKVLIQL